MIMTAKNSLTILTTYFRQKHTWVNIWWRNINQNTANNSFSNISKYYRSRWQFLEKQFSITRLTLMLLVANLANTEWCKNLRNDWNPGKWVLIWEYSWRTIQWIPIRQGLDGFQRFLLPCALDESSLSMTRLIWVRCDVQAMDITSIDLWEWR